jgi:hypothetical protein
MKFKHSRTERTNTNYRTWKKGKTWLYGCSVAAALVGGVMLSSQTVNAETPAGSPTISATSVDALPSDTTADSPEASINVEVSEPSLLMEDSSSIKETGEIMPASSTSSTASIAAETSTSAASSSAAQSEVVSAESSSVESANSEAAKAAEESASKSPAAATSAKIDRSDLVKAAIVNAVSSDVTITKTDGKTEIPASQALEADQAGGLGVRVNFDVNKNDLVAGNTIVIAKVEQTSTMPDGSPGEADTLVNFGAYTSGGTLLDDAGKVVGNVRYDSALKAIVLNVINTVNTDNPTPHYDMTIPQIMIINYVTPNPIMLNMPFTNTISVIPMGNSPVKKDYDFAFKKLVVSQNDATALYGDTFGGATASAQYTNFTETSYHNIIPSNEVLNELQVSHGKSGEILDNNGFMRSFNVSSEQMISYVGNTTISLGNYYVSAKTGKIQTNTSKNADETHATSMNRQINTGATSNAGNYLTLAELQTQAEGQGTGGYYSLQKDGSYLVVHYVSPDDMILTEAEIAANVRNNSLARGKTDKELEEDVAATIDFYHGVLQNRATTVYSYTDFGWADQYTKSTLTVKEVTDDGSETGATVGKPINIPNTAVGTDTNTT